MYCFFEGGRGVGGGGGGAQAARAIRRSRTVRWIFGAFPTLATWLTGSTADGVRRLYVVSNAAVVLVLVRLPYATMVSLEMYVSGLTTVAFACAFASLRRTQPELERPYVAAGGGLGRATALAALPIGVVAVYYAVGLRQALDGEMESVVGVAGLVGSVLLSALLHCFLGSACFKEAAAEGDDEEAERVGEQKEEGQVDEERRGLISS